MSAETRTQQFAMQLIPSFRHPCDMLRATFHFFLVMGGLAIALILIDHLVGPLLRGK